MDALPALLTIAGAAVFASLAAGVRWGAIRGRPHPTPERAGPADAAEAPATAPADTPAGTVAFRVAADGRLISVAGEVERMLGPAVAGVTPGKHWGEVLSLAPFRFEGGLLHAAPSAPTGERWLRRTTTPHRDGGRTELLQDITRDVQMQRAHRALLRWVTELPHGTPLQPDAVARALEELVGRTRELLQANAVHLLVPAGSGFRVLASTAGRDGGVEAPDDAEALAQSFLAGEPVGRGDVVRAPVHVDKRPSGVLRVEGLQDQASDPAIVSLAGAAADAAGMVLRLDEVGRRSEALASVPATRALESMSEAFLLLDRHLEVVYANPRADVWIRPAEGDDRQEGRSLAETLGGPGGPLESRLRKVLLTRRPTTFVEWLPSAGVWLEVAAAPAADDLSVHLRDVTERQDAKAALRESEARFRNVVESVGEGLVLVDLEGRVLYINPRLTDLTGFRPEEVLGRLSRDVLFLSEEEGGQAWHGSGATARYQAKLTRKDGSRIPVEVHASPLRDAQGETVGAVKALTDVTDRVAAEEEMRRSEQRYRALFEDDVAANFLATGDGRILACNRAFALMFGYADPSRAVGSMLGERQAAALLAPLRRMGALDFHEIEMAREGEQPLHLIANLRAERDEGGALREVRGHLLDVTDRKSLEEQLRQSQKMEAVGRLAGGIAHDFNNLLTAITGHAELLLLDVPVGSAMEEGLVKVRRAAGRAATLTSQLLAFSRRQILQPRVLHLEEVVEGMAEVITTLVGPHVRLERETDPELWQVRADPSRLEQVVLNLAVNARDAMPDGGTLRVVLRNDVVAEGPERPPLVPAGSWVVLEVADDGCGIRADDLPHVFEPFFTTKPTGQGTGLGLAMVYGIVKQSGGCVDLRSEVGSGTRVCVYLPPLAASEEAPGPEAAAQRPIPEETPEGSETILLVEDEHEVRALAKRLLERQGYTVVEAAHPREAIRVFSERGGRVDLLLTDVIMPEMNGPALARTLALECPHLRVLFISGFTDGSNLEGEGEAGGTRAFLAKPFRAGDLARSVRKLLDAPMGRVEHA